MKVRVDPERCQGHTLCFMRAPEAFELSEIDGHSTPVADEVPEDRREAVAAVLTEATYGLVVGSFEIDMSDGDVRFRTSLDLGRAEVDDAVLAALVSPLVARNLAAMDQWIDGLQAVAGGADPADVLG